MVLLLVHRRNPHLRALVTWTVVAAAGWLFGLGSAQVSGPAGGESPQEPWMFVLLGVGIAVYLLALVGLVVTERRASR